MTRLLLSVALSLALNQTAFIKAVEGQTVRQEAVGSLTSKVDNLFKQWDKKDSPGCALAVVENGRSIYQRGYGSANLAYDIPIKQTTVFHIASTSKQFTAMAIALLAQQGKISLDDDVRKYLPELPVYPIPITIRQMVYHTGGLNDGLALMNLSGWRNEDFRNTNDILTLASRQKKLNFKPGEKWAYNNTGYFLLAIIVERVTGQSLARFAETNIFKPLGMEHTLFRDDHTMELKERASGYEPAKNGGFRLTLSAFDVVGANGVNTTIEDLARWDENFYDGRVGGSAIIEQMTTPGTLSSGEQTRYGFGLFIGQYKGLKFIEHSGGDLGFQANLLRFPDQRFSVICLCNLRSTKPAELTRQVADIYLAGRFKTSEVNASKPLKTEAGVKLSEKELSRFAGLYFMPEFFVLRQVRMTNGKLMYGKPGGDESELLPLTENRFIVAGTPNRVELTFRSSRRDAPRHMFSSINGGKPFDFEPVQPVSDSPSRLTEYVGTYYSEELDAKLNLFIKDGKLVLRRPRAEADLLSPLFSDTFTFEMPPEGTVLVRFARNPRKLVTGLLISTDRIINLRFDKTPK